MLQAKPNLGWRDVRYILATTARMNDPGVINGWTTNVAGHPVNHKYGFGVVDATAAVALATDPGWNNLGPQLSYTTAVKTVGTAIPDDGTVTSSTITIPANPGGIQQLESVEIIFNASHEYSGDLKVTLTRPGGTESVLAETHFCDGQCSQYNAWVFSSVRYLDEAADGSWSLNVSDGDQSASGTFDSWQLKLYGH